MKKVVPGRSGDAAFPDMLFPNGRPGRSPAVLRNRPDGFVVARRHLGTTFRFRPFIFHLIFRIFA